MPSGSKGWGVLGPSVFLHPTPPWGRDMAGHTHLLSAQAFPMGRGGRDVVKYLAEAGLLSP